MNETYFGTQNKTSFQWGGRFMSESLQAKLDQASKALEIVLAEVLAEIEEDE